MFAYLHGRTLPGWGAALFVGLALPSNSARAGPILSHTTQVNPPPPLPDVAMQTPIAGSTKRHAVRPSRFHTPSPEPRRDLVQSAVVHLALWKGLADEPTVWPEPEGELGDAAGETTAAVAEGQGIEEVQHVGIDEPAPAEADEADEAMEARTAPNPGTLLVILLGGLALLGFRYAGRWLPWLERAASPQPIPRLVPGLVPTAAARSRR